MATIDKVCKEEVNSFVLFDPDIVRGLHRRGLMYFDVPVYSDDRFKGMHGNNHLSYEIIFILNMDQYGYIFVPQRLNTHVLLRS